MSDLAQSAVLVKSEDLPEGTPIVKGYNFNKGVNFDDLMKSYMTTGFQATSVGLAIEEINRMRTWRLSDEPITEETPEELRDPKVRANIKATIFFSYTSNLISSGLRDIIRFLVEHKMVDVIVTTAGGIEEDFIKCMAPTYIGDFSLDGRTLRLKGQNRIGNLLAPNKNYCMFEDFITPILNDMLTQQKTRNVIWTPSKMIRLMGERINNPESVYYWAYKNNIPVYSPAITDGSIGDMMYFHSYANPGLILDINADIRGINDAAMYANKTGMFIVGGGLIKHHVCNANLMRNGADWSVFVNTSSDYDGSDAGAKPDEAISWGKISLNAKPVKVYADATIVLPLIVAMTFAKDFTPSSEGK